MLNLNGPNCLPHPACSKALLEAITLLQSQNPLGIKLINLEISKWINQDGFNENLEKIVVQMN